jgi:hypothetical protein
LEVVPDLPNYVGRGAVNNFPITGYQRYMPAESVTKVFLSSLIWHLCSGFRSLLYTIQHCFICRPLVSIQKDDKNTWQTASPQTKALNGLGVAGLGCVV